MGFKEVIECANIGGDKFGIKIIGKMLTEVDTMPKSLPKSMAVFVGGSLIS